MSFEECPFPRYADRRTRGGILRVMAVGVVAILSNHGFLPFSPTAPRAETVAVTTTATAKPLRVVTWNAEATFSVDDVRKRAKEFEAMAKATKPDILLLQEVTSQAVVEAIRDTMGLKTAEGQPAYAVCSNFNPNDNDQFNSLEVAIISKFPLSQVIEFDTSPDNSAARHQPAEQKLVPPAAVKAPRNFENRGFLWARMDDVKLAVTVAHLKSSRGQYGRQDEKNAKQREYVAGAIVDQLAKQSAKLKGFSHIVGGDFNVGINDRTKNGSKLEEDDFDPQSGKDLFDDTHAIFAKGLIGGVKMKPLTAQIGYTFVGRGSEKFRVSGAIDTLYLMGPYADQPCPTVKSRDSFGSDHVPVMTEITLP